MFNYIENDSSNPATNRDELRTSKDVNRLKNLVESNDVKSRAYTDFLYGINGGFTPSSARHNRDVKKITFFTRPQLNMEQENIGLAPELHRLLTKNKNSVFNYIRHMLDPRLKFSKSSTLSSDSSLSSTLIDDSNPFIPILSNGLKSLSGWPDTVLPTHTSKEGIKKEQQSIADGTVEIFNSFDLDATFRNIEDDPISPLIRSWLIYMSKVFEGDLMPYLDMVIGNEIDYNTRIYTFVLGEAGNRIKRVACTGASFPLNVPHGKYFDISGNNPRTENQDINIRFKCDGAMYDDLRILNDFNKTVSMFNPAVRKLLAGEPGHGLVKVDGESSYGTRFRAIPVVDELRGTLDWYIPSSYIK